jgi:3-dehydroquinate synthase
MIHTVNLMQRSYPIFIDDPGDLIELLGQRFPGRRFALVTNTTIERLYRETLAGWEKRIPFITHVMPDGETHKTLATWQAVLDTLLSNRLDRQSVIIAFGGGVVGDIAGFAAAAFLRGVDCVQIPTTLLAMVDSSVGGKTGVDHPMGKNLIGAFHQPKLVWIDTRFLDTLPEREYVAGYAELFKYGFIGGRDMFDFIMQNHPAILAHDHGVLAEGIRRSVAIKAVVVEQDEFETTGQRALLNLGHTFGHALEKVFGFSGLLHGEAIWWGMACAVECGLRTGEIIPRDAAIYRGAAAKLIRPALSARPDLSALYDAMLSDKKVKSGKPRFVLPTAPGTSVVVDDIPPHMIHTTLAAVFGTTTPG